MCLSRYFGTLPIFRQFLSLLRDLRFSAFSILAISWLLRRIFDEARRSNYEKSQYRERGEAEVPEKR